MDASKLEKLQQLHYKIFPTCDRCLFGEFKGYDWGACLKHTYQHQKHSLSERQLSIHRSGGCVDFMEKEIEDLHGYKQFLLSDV